MNCSCICLTLLPSSKSTTTTTTTMSTFPASALPQLALGKHAAHKQHLRYAGGDERGVAQHRIPPHTPVGAVDRLTVPPLPPVQVLLRGAQLLHLCGKSGMVRRKVRTARLSQRVCWGQLGQHVKSCRRCTFANNCGESWGVTFPSQAAFGQAPPCNKTIPSNPSLPKVAA